MVQPLATVRPAIKTVVSPASPKTRLTPSPLTVRALAPGPLIVTPSVISSWPLVRAIVPVTAKSITSAPGLALAAATAARSEPGPVSSRLVTVKVLGSLRSSRMSRHGRNE
jgi:hypothetical protein